MSEYKSALPMYMYLERLLRELLLQMETLCGGVFPPHVGPSERGSLRARDSARCRPF